MNNKIKVPKSLSDGFNVDDDDFLLIKHSTLQYLKVDLFVAEDSPLHDGLESLKNDLVPARGAVASAKNKEELQVALLQLGQKVKGVQRIAKTENLETVEHYLARIAKKCGLDDPKLFIENKIKANRRIRKELTFEQAKLMREQERYEASYPSQKQVTESVGLIESVMKTLGVSISGIIKRENELRDKRLKALDAQRKESQEFLNTLHGYNHDDWIKVGGPISPWHPEYSLIKGKSVEVLKRFSLESIGIEPGNQMTPRDMISFLNNTNNLASLLAKRIGVVDEGIGLNGKLSIVGDTGSVPDARAQLSPSGSAIISLVGNVSGNDLTSAWTHAFTNYGLKNGVKVESLGNDFTNSVSRVGKDYIAVLETRDVNKIKKFKTQFNEKSLTQYWESVLGKEEYLGLADSDRVMLHTSDVSLAVKDLISGVSQSDVGLISVLYKNGVLEQDAFNSLLERVANPSTELVGVVSKLKSAYKDILDADNNVSELITGNISETLVAKVGSKESLIDINPSSVQMYGRYVGNHLFPYTSVKSEDNMLSSKLHTDSNFEMKKNNLLKTILGGNMVKKIERFVPFEELGKEMRADVTSPKSEGELTLNNQLIDLYRNGPRGASPETLAHLDMLNKAIERNIAMPLKSDVDAPVHIDFIPFGKNLASDLTFSGLPKVSESDLGGVLEKPSKGYEVSQISVDFSEVKNLQSYPDMTKDILDQKEIERKLNTVSGKQGTSDSPVYMEALPMEKNISLNSDLIISGLPRKLEDVVKNASVSNLEKDKPKPK